MKKPARNDKWVCPKCSGWVITHFDLVEPPKCTRHVGGAVRMTLISTDKPDSTDQTS